MSCTIGNLAKASALAQDTPEAPLPHPLPKVPKFNQMIPPTHTNKASHLHEPAVRRPIIKKRTIQEICDAILPEMFQASIPHRETPPAMRKASSYEWYVRDPEGARMNDAEREKDKMAIMGHAASCCDAKNPYNKKTQWDSWVVWETSYVDDWKLD